MYFDTEATYVEPKDDELYWKLKDLLNEHGISIFTVARNDFRYCYELEDLSPTENEFFIDAVKSLQKEASDIEYKCLYDRIILKDSLLKPSENTDINNKLLFMLKTYL